jgi:serine/threonine protein kinase
MDLEQSSYLALRNLVAERTNPLVLWIGAGLSRTAELPSWRGLRNSLCAEVARKIDRILDVEERKEIEGKLRQAREQGNLWIAFQILKDIAGQTTYRAVIRDKLQKAQTCPIPENYSLLWQLPRVKGVFSLNLDGLASRAYGMVHSGQSINVFNGKHAGNFVHALKQPIPFLVHLHGQLEDESSWVFTYGELSALLKNEAYLSFVEAVLMSFTILFVGITADDRAVDLHFKSLRRKGVDFGDHFWLTDRSDEMADEWAERSGVRIIYYESDAGDHGELTELLQDLRGHVSQDKKPRPIVRELVTGVPPILPTPTEILLQSPERIRDILNTHAGIILKEHSEDAHKKYQDFLKEYDRAVYHSWYTTTEEPDNRLFGYTLKRKIKRGAFGCVYEAYTEKGEKVAIKILREDVRQRESMLQSFRRGVQSMGILSKHNVHGMVPYRETSEIPAMAVMDFIEGPDLRDVVRSGDVASWEDVIRIALELANIIRTAHRLPERVLHRDIRPSNVMIDRFYTNPSEWEVVVLDFDLSWYRGAVGLSVHDASTISGYLAPEQLTADSSISTRNALVDSFGLGMTLYFLRTGNDPQYLQHKHADWEKVLRDSVVRYPCSSWQSLPARYARLIKNCTRDQQHERWDMAQVAGELTRLSLAVREPERVLAADMWVEEVVTHAASALDDNPVTWDQDAQAAMIRLPRGLQIRVVAREPERKLEASVEWSGTGTQEYKSVKKYLPDMCKRASDALRKGRWKLHGEPKYTTASAFCSAEIAVNLVRSNSQAASEALIRAVKEMRFH